MVFYLLNYCLTEHYTFGYNQFVELMTIGYEGLDLNLFFDLLRRGGVDTIVDVRQNPISRKRGFSKNALATAACDNGFRYIHLPDFGCPKTIRDDYRHDNDWGRYTVRFTAHLDTLQKPIALLSQQATMGRCCLLCFEADPATCHRSFVAERVAATSITPLSVVHLRITNQAMTA